MKNNAVKCTEIIQRKLMIHLFFRQKNFLLYNESGDWAFSSNLIIVFKKSSHPLRLYVENEEQIASIEEL